MAKGTVELELIDITDEDTWFYLPVKVGGKLGHFLLDTGATKSVFNGKLFKSVFSKCKNGKPWDVYFDTGNKTITLPSYLAEVEIGGLKLSDFTCNVQDDAAFLDLILFDEIPTAGGIIGNDILFKINAIIDYKKRILKVS